MSLSMQHSSCAACIDSEPIKRWQRLRLAAVSWSTPTLTHPAFAARSSRKHGKHEIPQRSTRAIVLTGDNHGSRRL
jgi:hypothetical protein